MNPDVAKDADMIAEIERREERSPLSFAPPDVSRLGLAFQRPRRTYHDPGTSNQRDRLCQTCKSIDILSLFKNGLLPDCGGLVPLERGVSLGYSDQIYANAGCPFCRLVVDIGDTNLAGDDREVEFWSLKTVFGHEVLTSREKIGNHQSRRGETINATSAAIYIAVVRSIKPPPGYGFEYRTIVQDNIYIGLLNQEKLTARVDFGPRLHDPQSANSEVIKNWLDRCATHKTCNNIPPVSGQGLSLRVLDVKTLQVIDLPKGSPYIALSYVRGKTPDIQQRDIYTLSDLPRFFQDAITLVRALKYRYVWTDFICIDSDDSAQRAADIDRMGTIDRQAYATIINAAASDARENLPGLGGAARLTWQRSEHVGDMDLVTSLPSLEMTVKTSVWGRRGWTFQGGIVSPRCIVFGPEQVYYECAEETYCESIVEPVHLISDANAYRLAQPPNSPFCKGGTGVLRDPFLNVATTDSTALYWSLVSDYTSRDLTHASDSLRAFHGFFESFSNLRNMSFLWGIPQNPDLPRNLLWEHGPWISMSVTRRPEFPSWSWAGWAGGVYMNSLPENVNVNDRGSGQANIFTLKIHYLAYHNDETAQPNKERYDAQRVLSCTANTASITLSVTMMLVNAEGEGKSSFILECDLAQTGLFHGQRCQYMEVCHSRGFMHGLLLRPRLELEAVIFERIGSGFMQMTTFKAADWERGPMMLG